MYAISFRDLDLDGDSFAGGMRDDWPVAATLSLSRNRMKWIKLEVIDDTTEVCFLGFGFS